MIKDGETKSKAALKYTQTTPLTWPLLVAQTRLLYMDSSAAVMVDLPLLYPCKEVGKACSCQSSCKYVHRHS